MATTSPLVEVLTSCASVCSSWLSSIYCRVGVHLYLVSVAVGFLGHMQADHCIMSRSQKFPFNRP